MPQRSLNKTNAFHAHMRPFAAVKRIVRSHPAFQLINLHQ
jgi:hypothetical protein